MNPQISQLALDPRKIQEEIQAIDNGLRALRDSEIKLAEIKYKLESVINAFQNSDIKKIKSIKEMFSNLTPFDKLEETLHKFVLPIIRPSRNRIDSSQYRKYLQNQNQTASLKTFREEYNVVLQDQTVYRNFKAFSSLYGPNEKAFFDISYDILLKTMDEFVNWDKGILVRFEKSTELADLPQTFVFCYVRVDLITVTLTFRKIASLTASDRRDSIDYGDDEAALLNQNNVTLINIVYSHIFDPGLNVRKQDRSEPFYINFEKVNPDDPEIRELIEVIHQNQHRISLPCLYPGMALFQRFSCYMAERVEVLYKHAKEKDINMKDSSNPKKFFGMIVKQSLDEFIKATENRCDSCKKKFGMDSQYQKMLPPLVVKSEQQRGDARGDRLKCLHSDCKKAFKTNEITLPGPQIVVEIDCTEPSRYFGDKR